MKIFPILISGGSGSRLWPVSRANFPKPFVTLPDGQTLIEKAYLRARRYSDNCLTVTNQEYFFLSQEILDKINYSSDFLLEPFGKNTAPAIALASHYVSHYLDEDTCMLILPADQLIEDIRNFDISLKKATQLAQENYLVTFGIKPLYPETGFGYIEKGSKIKDGFMIKNFIEKPNITRAAEFIKSDNFLWNSGIFCFKPKVFLDELAIFEPELDSLIKDCWKNVVSVSKKDKMEVPLELFKNVKPISVDYAVMEKSSKVAVIEAVFQWKDIGSWKSFSDLLEPDIDGNKFIGNVCNIDSKKTFVYSENRLVTLVGVDDLIVVDTQDALLILNPKNAQDVRKLVEKLSEFGSESCDIHPKVYRPWGNYTVLQEGNGYKIKRILVKAFSSLSLQLHKNRSEHWVVVSGQAKVTLDDKIISMGANQSAYITPNQKHRLENEHSEDCILIEIQCGEYLGEDDIERFDDIYGR